MKVRSFMTAGAVSCGPGATLGEAARTMRQFDVGLLPVVEEARLVGVITDRDICVALAERDRPASELKVEEAMSRSVYACGEQESLSTALATMRTKRVRRLPVLDRQGLLCGILSMNDVILRAEESGEGGGVSFRSAVEALRGISEHRYPVRPAEPADVTELARFV